MGAGTMGSGIAQVAAQSGIETVLFDVNADILQKAKTFIEKNLDFLLGRQKLTQEEVDSTIRLLNYTTEISDCRADLVIEAIVENISAKVSVFNQLAGINSPDCIFASNTSSLSISALQQEITFPHRVAGMHFFNPAPMMKLVELVKGDQTDGSTIETLSELCKKFRKTSVVCKDAPGFIVNRIARHYYLEAMKILENGNNTIEEIDAIMESCGFKMGPFKLMDLIGMDINLAVSTSIYDAFQHEPRFKPSNIQIKKVEAGKLGRKTGEGFYQYG